VQALTIKTIITMAKTSLPSWSLVAFARQYGKMQVGSFINEEGTPFKSCIFTDTDGNKTFVGFSQNLGELTPTQIASQKDRLQIVKTETGKLRLCKIGESNWQDVDLGI
jgi:hypothetical protein